jgi:hypothetical protein
LKGINDDDLVFLTILINKEKISVTCFGSIFANEATLGYFLLNQFSPKQAVSTHGLLSLF